MVSVHAASVNPIDWQIRDGLLEMVMRIKLPGILGCDFATSRAKSCSNALSAQSPHCRPTRSREVLNSRSGNAEHASPSSAFSARDRGKSRS